MNGNLAWKNESPNISWSNPQSIALHYDPTHWSPKCSATPSLLDTAILNQDTTPVFLRFTPTYENWRSLFLLKKGQIRSCNIEKITNQLYQPSNNGHLDVKPPKNDHKGMLVLSLYSWFNFTLLPELKLLFACYKTLCRNIHKALQNMIPRSKGLEAIQKLRNVQRGGRGSTILLHNVAYILKGKGVRFMT